MTFLKKLGSIDRRIIYVMLALSIAIPLAYPLGLPMGIARETRLAYEYIEALPLGSNVLLSFDYGISYIPELSPQAQVLLHQLRHRAANVVTVSCTPEGPMLARDLLNLMYRDEGMIYGVHFVNLGFFAGGESGLTALAENVRSVYPRDFDGTPVDQLPLMAGISSIHDFELVITLNSGSAASTIAWVRQVHTAHQVPLLMGVVTVMAPTDLAFLHAGQIVGLLGGLRAAAEYELLVERPGEAVAALDAQSISHLLILGFIAVGNIAFFMQRRQERRG